jgi:hypothetical protein
LLVDYHKAVTREEYNTRWGFGTLLDLQEEPFRTDRAIQYK